MTNITNLLFSVLIGSLNLGLLGLLSPASSLLIQYVGFRITAVFGTALGSLGLLLSSFTNRIEILFLTYGVCLGLAMAIMLIPSYAILPHYFKKRIGLVNGIVALGGAVFTIILPFLWRIVLREFGVEWMLRILSGLFASLMLCAIIWKPQFPINTTKKKSNVDNEQQNEAQKDVQLSGASRFISSLCNRRIWHNRQYVIWAISMPVFFLGFGVPQVHIVSICYFQLSATWYIKLVGFLW